MSDKQSRSTGRGIERSCRQSRRDWFRSTNSGAGVELFEAWFGGYAYDRHRHDTYAIGLTDTGVQAFNYRGAAHASTAGKVIVLHPDEAHDGQAGSDEGFGYRMLYVSPARIFEAVRLISGRAAALPFVPDVVSTNPKLSQAIQTAFHNGLEPLAIDSLILELAEALVSSDPSSRPRPVPRVLDLAALERARQFFDTERDRVVTSSELEAITGLTRYDLARQFRRAFATSPYRYSLGRRLDSAREGLNNRRPIVEVALDAGFADQAHFTRMFKSAYGLTPARYASLHAS
jgi:AraC-like DNA-binding protein